jgi:hypothetical protein
MRMKYRTLLLIAAVSLAQASSVFSANRSPQELRVALAAAKPLEIPRETAGLISELNGPDREKLAIDIVRWAVELNPASAGPIVGSAARVAPELAAKMSSTAAALQPKLAPAIARAAASSAPASAAEIAAAVARERPAQYAAVSCEVAYAVPGRDPEIVNAVVASLPNLKSFALTDETSPNTKVTDLLAIAPVVESAASTLGMKTEQFLVTELTPAQQTKVSTINSAHSVVKGVPFAPAAGTPGEGKNPNDFTVTPGKGRDYATLPANRPPR